MKDQIISLQVIPKASKNEVIGWTCGADGRKSLKIKVCAPPKDGKANKAVLELLAGHWGCARRDLELVSGATARHKLLKINNTSLHRTLLADLS